MIEIFGQMLLVGHAMQQMVKKKMYTSTYHIYLAIAFGIIRLHLKLATWGVLLHLYRFGYQRRVYSKSYQNFDFKILLSKVPISTSSMSR